MAVAALLMGAAGSYQFLWSSFRYPLGAHLGASGSALGLAFTLYAITQSLSQFPAGLLRDARGPKLPLLIGGTLGALGFIGTSWADALGHLYLFYAIGGAGAGVVYTVAINTPVKWFRRQRGLAAGVVAMFFGAGSAFLVPWVRSAGLDALVPLGVLFGIAALVALAVLRDPGSLPSDVDNRDSDLDPTKPPDIQDDPDFHWRDVLKTWQFWLLYAVFIVVNGVGLMLISKSVSFASALGFPAQIATSSAALIALADGTGLVSLGWLSDKLGRERTAALALVGCGLSISIGVVAGMQSLQSVFLIGMGGALFFRSSAFAIYPSLIGDYYGARDSSSSYALLYTAKLWGGLLGGAVSALLIERLSWNATFLLGAASVFAAGLLLLLLRPPSRHT